MPNSKAFVIRSIKNGETSLIVSCYLEDIGYKTFIVKKNFRFNKKVKINGVLMYLSIKFVKINQ